MLRRRSQGHKFGSHEYADAVADRLRPQQEDRPRRERGPSMMAPVSRSIAIVVKRSNDAKPKRN